MLGSTTELSVIILSDINISFWRWSSSGPVVVLLTMAMSLSECLFSRSLSWNVPTQNGSWYLSLIFLSLLKQKFDFQWSLLLTTVSKFAELIYQVELGSKFKELVERLKEESVLLKGYFGSSWYLYFLLDDVIIILAIGIQRCLWKHPLLMVSTCTLSFEPQLIHISTHIFYYLCNKRLVLFLGNVSFIFIFCEPFDFWQ